MILGRLLFLPPTRAVLQGLVPIAACAPEGLTTISFLMPAPPAPFVPEHCIFQSGARDHVRLRRRSTKAGAAALAPFRALSHPAGRARRPDALPRRSTSCSKEAEQRGASVPSVALPSTPRMAPSTRSWPAHGGSELADGDDPDPRPRWRDGPRRRTRRRPSPIAMRRSCVSRSRRSRIRPSRRSTMPGRRTTSRRSCPYATGVYSNFLEDEGDARVREAYPPQTYHRLADVKRRYDPTNLFHLNQNIAPATRPDPDASAIPAGTPDRFSTRRGAIARRYRSCMARPIAFLSDLGVRDETVGVCHAVMRPDRPGCRDHRYRPRRPPDGRPDRCADPPPGPPYLARRRGRLGGRRPGQRHGPRRPRRQDGTGSADGRPGQWPAVVRLGAGRRGPRSGLDHRPGRPRPPGLAGPQRPRRVLAGRCPPGRGDGSLAPRRSHGSSRPGLDR